MQFRRAHAEDGIELTKRGLREWDLREMQSLYPDHEPVDLVCGSVGRSTAAIAMLDDEEHVIALGGVTTDLRVDLDTARIGQIWMLASDDVFEHPIVTFMSMRRYLREWQRSYDGMYNWVASGNMKALRMLQLLGFSFIGPQGQAPQKVVMDEVEFIRFWWAKGIH